MKRKKNKNKGFRELLNQSVSLKQRIERQLGLPFFDNLIELVRRRVWYFSDMQAAYYGGVIITGVEERFALRNIENFSDGHSFTFWFLSKGLSQLDLSRQQKIIGHLQREEYEHEDCTMLAIYDLLTAAGGVRGEHYYQSGNDMIPLDAGWELLDQVFRNDEFSAITESLIDKTGE